MADPVTLVILVAAGEAMAPGTSAMAQGARDAFAGTTADLRETPGAPTDADATTVEAESHPDAVAELVWRDVDHRHATLRVHLRRSGRWIRAVLRVQRLGPGDGTRQDAGVRGRGYSAGGRSDGEHLRSVAGVRAGTDRWTRSGQRATSWRIARRGVHTG